MASLRKAKKQAKKEGRTFINPVKVDRQLKEQARRNILETNRRLRNLDRSGNYGSFASKKLFDRLGSKKLNVLNRSKKVNRGKVLSLKLKNNINNTDLTAIIKATSQFLKSATSTIKGLNDVVEKTKRSMLETLKTENKDITKEDIEDYYNMLGDKDFDFFNEKIGASEMWGILEDATEAGDNSNEFVSRLENYITLGDVDVKKKALNLFNKYVL